MLYIQHYITLKTYDDVWPALLSSLCFLFYLIVFYLFIFGNIKIDQSWWLTIPGGSDSKESAFYMRDPSSIPGLERTLGEGKGNPLQYFCLKNPMNRGAWQATVHRDAESVTGLSD